MTEFSSRIKSIWLNIFRPHLAAGLKAEKIFAQQALQNRWLLEKIPQDKENFKRYKEVASDPVKRGDFICRNCNNLEIEVKCKSVYSKKSTKVFLIEYSQIKRHMEMNKLTDSKTIFAFYERNGSSVVENSLRMVDLDFLQSTHDYKKGRLYNAKLKCVEIPFKYTRPGFEVLSILVNKTPRQST